MRCHMRIFTLKNRIAYYRNKLGITQRQLADKVKVSQNSISSFERFKYCPSAFTAILLCQALNVSFSELFYLD